MSALSFSPALRTECSAGAMPNRIPTATLTAALNSRMRQSGDTSNVRGRPLDINATRDVVVDYLTWHLVVNGGASILEALEIEERYKVSFWDALVIGAAQACGANVLYSEDLSDGQMYGSVRVVNPFAAGPATP